MKITHKDFTISFDNKYLPEEATNREYETSYLNTFKVKDGKVKIKKDSFNKLHCYQNILAATGSYKTNLDVFGGVGITAKMFNKGIPYVNEISKECIEILKDNFENVYAQRIENFHPNMKYDLVLADYNNFTIKKFLSKGYANTLQTCFDCANKYVVLNDSSMFFLKYGKKSYDIYSDLLGTTVTNPEEMFLAEKQLFEKNYAGWHMNRVEYFNNAAIILFSRHDTVLNINKLSTYKEVIDLTL